MAIFYVIEQTSLAPMGQNLMNFILGINIFSTVFFLAFDYCMNSVLHVLENLKNNRTQNPITYRYGNGSQIYIHEHLTKTKQNILTNA